MTENSEIPEVPSIDVSLLKGKNYTTIYGQESSNPFNGHVRWTEWQAPSTECVECRFYDGIPGTDSGICHRFPKEEVIENDYWCGEFHRKNSRMQTK
jgi:hypothetical protein